MRGAALLWLLATGCFDPKFDNPACGPAGECPPGLVCIAGVCGSPVDIDAPPIDTPPGAVTVELQQGLAGYTRTRDTYLNGGSNNAHDTEQQVRWGKDDKFGLLSFDGIFAGPSAIPMTATILTATLTLQVTNGAEGMLYDVEVMWPATVTYNTFGAAPGVDIVADLADLVGPIPNATGVRTFDVLDSVKRWQLKPDLYQGWCLYGNSTDEGSFRSSEDGNIALRPKLTVVFFP